MMIPQCGSGSAACSDPSVCKLFASVDEFCAAVRPDGPACLVLDVRLPGRSGLDFQEELARANFRLPIIFISGHADVSMSVRAGTVEFLTKPVRGQDLLDAIQQAIAQDRACRDDERAVVTPAQSVRHTLTLRKLIALERAGWHGPGRFRPEGPRRVALRPVRDRDFALARQLLGSQFPVLRARQRCEEGDEIVDLCFRQGQGLNVFVEIRVLQTITLVVVVDDIPQRLRRAVVKVWSRHQNIADVRCLEGGDVSLFLGDQKAAKCREVRSNGGLIDCLCVARVNELLGLTRQGDDILSDNADADVVKVIVGKGRDVPLLFRERVAFVAAGLGVEQLPAALCRFVDGISIAPNEVVERRIERNLRPFVGCDCAHQIGAIRPPPEDLLETLPVFFDRPDPSYGGIQTGLTYFNRIDDRQRRLLLKRFCSSVPELGLVVEGVQNGQRVALADAAFDADRSCPAIGESAGGIVTGTTRDGPVGR
jgi:CheY-like chemotaxis protein